MLFRQCNTTPQAPHWSFLSNCRRFSFIFAALFLRYQPNQASVPSCEKVDATTVQLHKRQSRRRNITRTVFRMPLRLYYSTIIHQFSFHYISPFVCFLVANTLASCIFHFYDTLDISFKQSTWQSQRFLAIRLQDIRRFSNFFFKKAVASLNLVAIVSW